MFPTRSIEEALIGSDNTREDKLSIGNLDPVNNSLDETNSKGDNVESDVTSSDETPAYDSDYKKGKGRGTIIQPQCKSNIYREGIYLTSTTRSQS